jgi:hypothetical protein
MAGNSQLRRMLYNRRKKMTGKLTDHYGDVGPGWAAILTMLHTELQQAAPDYETLQVKEKFGGLRAYINIPSAEFPQGAFGPYQAAHFLEYKYEALSLQVCEHCGRQGKNRPGPRSWFKTLCDEHERDRWTTG